jgi:hypothetical protein
MTGSRSKTVRIVEIAELLGVSKQGPTRSPTSQASPRRSPRTVAGGNGISARSRRGRSVGAARSPGASRTADELVRSASQDQP